MILSPKHLPRLAAIVGLFTNYGLRDFAKRQGLLDIEGPGVAGTDGEGDGDAAAKAKAFRKRLVELGPAYINPVNMGRSAGKLLEPFMPIRWL